VGEFAVKAVAFDDRGLSITSAPVYLNVEREPSLAKLVETTENLLGTWSGRFGSLAYAIPGLKTNFTGANGSLFINEATEEIFPDSTLGPGLADGKGGTIKSAWAGVGGLDIRYEPPSARPHRLTIYLADYENMADLRVSLIDLFTGSNLAAHRVHDAGTGRFLSWIVRGPILLRVQSLTDSPARVSGVFTDLIPAPKVELNLAARNILLPGGTMLSAKVDGGLQGVHTVRFFNGMTLLGEDHQSPYEFNWTNLLEGEHSILARAIGAYGLNGDSDRVLLKCDLPEAKALVFNGDGLRGVKTYAAHNPDHKFSHFLPPPHFGEHTVSVLQNFLNYSTEKVDSLRRRGIIF